MYHEMEPMNRSKKSKEKGSQADSAFNRLRQEGDDAHTKGDFQQALDCYRKALIKDPDSAVIWNNLGLTFKELGREDKAIKCYYKALELEPNYPASWYNTGELLYEMDEFEDALYCFNTVGSLDADLARNIAHKRQECKQKIADGNKEVVPPDAPTRV